MHSVCFCLDALFNSSSLFFSLPLSPAFFTFRYLHCLSLALSCRSTCPSSLPAARSTLLIATCRRCLQCEVRVGAAHAKRSFNSLRLSVCRCSPLPLTPSPYECASAMYPLQSLSQNLALFLVALLYSKQRPPLSASPLCPFLCSRPRSSRQHRFSSLPRLRRRSECSSSAPASSPPPSAWLRAGACTAASGFRPRHCAWRSMPPSMDVAP